MTPEPEKADAFLGRMAGQQGGSEAGTTQGAGQYPWAGLQPVAGEQAAWITGASSSQVGGKSCGG